MKKLLASVIPFLVLSAMLFGQVEAASPAGDSVPQTETVAGMENDSAGVSVLSDQEFRAQVLSWENLASLSFEQYLASLHQFISMSSPHYEMQPYVLAECLWFQIVMLPRFQLPYQEGGPDGMVELDEDLLLEVQELVDGFFSRLERGLVAIHPWADAVLGVFRELGKNPPLGESLPDFNGLPLLSSLAADQLFVPVDANYRNVRLYHGLMDFHGLVEQFTGAATQGSAQEEEASEPDVLSSAEEAGTPDSEKDVSLPPPVGGIDWKEVVSNQPLMYLLRHFPSGGQIYRFLLDYHSGETAASRCQDLYLQGRRIGEQWGFMLEQILPDFSAAGIQAVGDDLFILHCLPENDLARLSADLACVNRIAPVYFGRWVALLHRPASRETVAKENGGSL